MSLFGVLTLAAALIKHRGRVSYRALQQQFDLDDSGLEALRLELIQVEQVAVDENGEFLVWAGDQGASHLTTQAVPALQPMAKQPPNLQPDLVEPDAQADPEPEKTFPEAASQPQSASDAERRPLTVMFCDLADSTALSTKLDPEDLQDVIRAYQERSTELIREYEGFVAKYMGDGILVYFGYPKSLERNVEHAVRSGLSIIEAMADLNHTLGREKGIEIAVRIGISTGMVIVGEVVGEGLAQERTVIGEAPNIAARLQGLARRNGIVIGSLTKELAGDAFDYEDLGGQDLKGIDGKVLAYGVTGLKGKTADDLDMGDTGDLAEIPQLIGRDEETGLLRRAWQSTKEEGRGQIVTIAGEAGIGKSVLIDGLAAQVRAERLPRVTYRCSPYHTGSALYPAIEHFKRLSRWQPDDSVEARLTKLEKMLDAYDQPLAETVPLLGGLMSLPIPEDRYSPLGLSPQQLKQQTQDTIIAMTMEEAERQPHLQIWEDLHWADASTLELLGLLIDQAPTASLLIVLTARPEFVPPWPGRSHNIPITLNRLERRHTEALVARIAEKPLPHEVVDHIVAKTDGVPLYVEELSKTILASDILRDTGDRFELTGPLSSLSIPETLQGSLMARLDRLPQVREIAQIGSVLGREFAYDMISGLSAITESTLEEGLGQLVDAELLYQRGRPPRAKYIFKHALVQDAAYESLLNRARQQYHRQVAELLEARFAEAVKAQPELVAHHYTEAAEPAKAFTFWKTAAQRALKASAIVEAVSHLESALCVLADLPEGQARDEQELDAQMLLGPAKLAIKGYAFPPLEDTYNRALELSMQLDKPVERILMLRGLQVFHMVGGRLEQALSLAEQIATLVKKLDDPAFCVAGAHVVGQTNFFCGNLSTALREVRKGAKIYDPDKHQIPNWPGAGAGEQCHLYAALILWMQGYREKALKNCEAAISFADRNANKFTLANTLSFVTLLRAMNKDMNETRELAEQSVPLCEEHSNTFWLQFNRMIQGWARLETGDPRECVEEMQQAMFAFRETGAGLFIPYLLALQAEGLAKIGKPDEGLGAVDEALSIIKHTGERCWEANIHRVNGDLILAASGAASDAEKSYLEAIRVAQGQDAKSWELQAAIHLAMLWRDQGKHAEAHRLLADTYGWFTEGFDTPDLSEAKQLLKELSERQVA